MNPARPGLAHLADRLSSRLAAQLTLRILDGGHYLPEERPDTVAAAIRTMTGPGPGLPAPVNDKNGST